MSEVTERSEAPTGDFKWFQPCIAPGLEEDGVAVGTSGLSVAVSYRYEVM